MAIQRPNRGGRDDRFGSDGRIPPWHLPRIIDLRAARARYEEPKIFYVGSERREVDEAVEIRIETDSPIPAQASSPILYVGETEVIEYRMGDDDHSYVYYALEPRRLREGAEIAFGWPEMPAERRQRTRFRYTLGAAPIS